MRNVEEVTCMSQKPWISVLVHFQCLKYVMVVPYLSVRASGCGEGTRYFVFVFIFVLSASASNLCLNLDSKHEKLFLCHRFIPNLTEGEISF